MEKLFAKPVIELRKKTLLAKALALKAKAGRTPHLTVVLIGRDPASEVYVGKKGKAAEEVGFTHETILFAETASASEIKQKISELNSNPNVDGILVQRPLPKHLDEREAIYWVAPEKDVDCLHPENIGLLVSGNPRFSPCTPGGILILLEHYQIKVAKKVVCVIGRSAIVGKPLAALLLSKDATVIQIHRATPAPQTLCKLADIVFVAAGAKGLVDASWIKPGAVVVDVGIHRDANNKLSGDVDADSLAQVASAITPVPGGVGPMTIQVLLENTLSSALTYLKC